MEYVLNPIFGVESGKVTNKQLLELARTQGLINDRDYDIIAKHLQQNPQFADDYNWGAGDPNTLASGIDNKISEGFSRALSNLWGSVYTSPSQNPSANPSQHSQYIDAQGNFTYPQVDYSADGRQVVDFAKGGYGGLIGPQAFQNRVARANTPVAPSVTPAAPNYPTGNQQPPYNTAVQPGQTQWQGGLLGSSTPSGNGLLSTNYGQQMTNMNNQSLQRNQAGQIPGVSTYASTGPGGRESPMGPHKAYTGDNTQPYYGMGPQIPLTQATNIYDMANAPGASLFNLGSRQQELQQLHRPVYSHYAANEANAWNWGGPQVIDRGDESYYFRGINPQTGLPHYASPSTGSVLNRGAWEELAKLNNWQATSDQREANRQWDYRDNPGFSQALRGLLG